MKILALILAKGGSKRIYKKNIALLGGKPLIEYTIEAAKKSKRKLKIVVSTDDPDIAGISRKLGAEAPFLRPPEISTEDSTEYEAIVHALTWLEKNRNYRPDIIVKLFPTSPFRKPESIDACVDKLIKHRNVDSVRAVRLCKEHPCKMWTVNFNRLQKAMDCGAESHVMAYHQLPTVYVNAASIDAIWTRTILKKHSVTGTSIVPFVMSEEEAFDINTPLDMKMAELIISNKVI
jgi:CMP-N,N'-diacetyllegionaminic acid synthase